MPVLPVSSVGFFSMWGGRINYLRCSVSLVFVHTKYMCNRTYLWQSPLLVDTEQEFVNLLEFMQMHHP